MSDQFGPLETNRLLLRPLEVGDIASLQLLGTDEVFGFVPEIDTPFDANTWVRHKLENECPTVGHLILEKPDRSVAGYVQVDTVVGDNGYYIGVGYWLGEAYWGNGYAAEALSAAIAALQSATGNGQQLIPVHARVMPENQASIRVLEKVGFVRSGPPNGNENKDDMIWFHWPPSAVRHRAAGL